MMKRFLILFATLFLGLSSFVARPDSDVTTSPDDEVRIAQNRVLYEVFVRNFSAAGNFKGVEAQIPRIKNLGVDVIWLMPIYKLGDIGLWGRYSSPYAVKDYKAVNPDYGTEADLRSLIKTIHDNGMEVWFDWVGNHTSMDNVWVSQHPEFYQKKNNNFVNPNGWNDVYQLDVNNSAMHDAMIEAMQYWVDNFDIDGYRCDYAGGPSTEFWSKATSRVLKNGKRIAWLAEDDSKPELVRNGYFDYNWTWGFQQNIKSFTDNATANKLNSLKNFCKNLHNDANYKGKSRLVYLETHDIVQDQGGSSPRLYGNFLKPMTVLEFTVYGMPMLYNGQEIGYNCGAISLAEKSTINWNNPNTEITNLVTTLANLKHTQPALRDGSQNGTYTELNAGDNLVFAFKRTLQNSNVVVLLNFNSTVKTFSISSGLPEGTYKDVFSNTVADFSTSKSFTLPAYGYAVYVNTEDSGFVEPAEPGSTPLPEEATVADFTTDSNRYIYIEDNTGWDNIGLYAWGDAEAFGGWPGAKAEGCYAVGSHFYKRIQVPSDHNGKTVNLIGNNYNPDNNIQFDIKEVTLNGDIYLTYTPAAGYEHDRDYCIYVIDNTGWDNSALYGWQSNQTEIFGGWPGKRAADDMLTSLNGHSVHRYIADSSFKGIEYNMIVNNTLNGGSDGAIQYDWKALKMDRDHFYTIGHSATDNNSTSHLELDPHKQYIFFHDVFNEWNECYVKIGGGDRPVKNNPMNYAPGSEAAIPTIGAVKTVAPSGSIAANYKIFVFEVPEDLKGTEFYATVYSNNKEYKDLHVDLTGNHDIRFNLDGSTTGVDKIEIDSDEETIYYNLQGIRVNNPKNDIYIVVKGKNVTRQYIK